MRRLKVFNISSYEEAVEYIDFYMSEAVMCGCEPNVCFAPIDGVYEILGQFHEVDGKYIGLENEYVTEETAFAIAADFGIEILEVE